MQELRQRIRQQSLLAELGVQALKGTPFSELLDLTAKLAADGLGAEFAKVLEHIRAENRLLIRAGVGWPPGIVGVASVGCELASPAGFALRTGKPVISNHLENEERFDTPEVLAEQGVRRAMNVILQGDGTPYGVLEVDSRSEGEFGEHDIAFLQGAANLLGMAIERQRIEANLRAAVSERELLLKELDHRVSNSLQVVMSMLHLQAAGADNGVRQQLVQAAGRIAAVARAHQRLRVREGHGLIDLIGYLDEVCRDLATSVGPCDFTCSCPEPVLMPSDRAVSVGLILIELVTNAVKHAYAGREPGPIRIVLEPAAEASLRLTVHDEGRGLPTGFSLEAGSGLGTRIILALSQRLAGRVEVTAPSRGTSFALVLPATADAPSNQG
ncbi:MAG: histidine kinase dimerization/phosphoacceptor domain -containing protein [Geminicoccaceae bacterium]